MRKRRPAPPLPSPAGGGGVLDAQGEEAAGALVAVPGGAYASAVIGPEPVEIHLEPARDDSARGGPARLAAPRQESRAPRAGGAAPRRGGGTRGPRLHRRAAPRRAEAESGRRHRPRSGRFRGLRAAGGRGGGAPRWGAARGGGAAAAPGGEAAASGGFARPGSARADPGFAQYIEWRIVARREWSLEELTGGGRGGAAPAVAR